MPSRFSLMMVALFGLSSCGKPSEASAEGEAAANAGHWPADLGIEIGQRVVLTTTLERLDPDATGYPRGLRADFGHTGRLIGGRARDSGPIEFGKVLWDVQAWYDTDEHQLVTLGEFETYVHLDYLNAAKAGNGYPHRGYPNTDALQTYLDAKAAEEAEAAPKTCPEGGCVFVCDSACTATCDGGGCVQTCTENAVCGFDCTGGKCKQTCESGSICGLSCTPKDCERDYAEAQVDVDDTAPLRSL